MPTFSFSLIFLLLLILFVVIQLLYYVFVFSRLAYYKVKDQETLIVNHPITIIVCAFNEDANLTKNLPLLLEQNYFKNGKPHFEVLVVNHNSEDDTPYLLNRMKEEYAHLSVLHLTQDAKLIKGKKFPLSMGIKQAAHEHLLLTDADCVPASKDWLLHMANGFSETKKIVLGYSPYIEHEEPINIKVRLETAHTAIQYLSFALMGIPYMGVGRNLAYVRDLFNKNKGFSSHHHIMSGDDDLFINQIADSKNTAIVIHPDAFTFSEPKRTRVEWDVQKSRHLSTGKYYKFKHKFLLGAYGFSHFASWFLLLVNIIFFKFLFIALPVFIIRLIVNWIMFKKCFILLQAKDLVSQILFFDVWLLYYHLKNVPSIFFKNQSKWK